MPQLLFRLFTGVLLFATAALSGYAQGISNTFQVIQSPGATVGQAGASVLQSSNGALSVKAFGAKGDGVSNDTAALVAARNAACAGNRELYFPAGTYLTDPLNLACSGADYTFSGLHAFGQSPQSSILKARGTGATIEITGNVGLNSTLIERLGVQGSGSGTAHCIYIHDNIGSPWAIHLEHLSVDRCGGSGVFAKQAFSSVMRDVQIGQGAGKVIGKNGLDLAGMWKLENVYVHVAGNGYAAYRIHNGAIFDHCNGIDTGPTGNFDWAVVGDNVAEDGVLNKASVTFIGSNIESFTRYGVRFKDYSFGTFIQTSIIGGNGSTVSVQALRWELTNPNDGGIFDARSSVALASNASWANGYPLHVANGGAPIYMMGTNGNLNQFYRESDSTAYALNSLVGVALPVTTGYFVVGNYGALSATNRLYLDANGYAAARNGFNSGRYLLSNGGGVRTADFALSAGWGATASVTALAGMDQSFDVTVISSGGGQAANPTITHTHRDGAFSTAPGIVCAMNGGTGTLALVSAKTTKTSAVITYSGTPVAGSTYSFTCNLWGR